MNIKIGISTQKLQAIYGDREALRLAKSIGADAVDFFTNHFSVTDNDSVYARPDNEIVAYFTELGKYAKELGIEISQTHGRLRIYLNNPELDAAWLENARLDLLAASSLGAPVCVMHGVTTSVMGPDTEPQRMRELCYEQFSKRLSWAKLYGVKLATETFGYCSRLECNEFFANAVEFKNIFDRISAEGDNNEYFTICVDTGHSNTSVRFGDPSVGDVIRMYGKNISCLHLHDNDGVHDQHKVPMTGTIDWEDVCKALDEIGYEGVYNLEVNWGTFGKGFELETAEFSIKMLRFLLEQHQVKNGKK